MRDLIARNVGYSTNTENPLGPVEVVYLIEEPARAKPPVHVLALEALIMVIGVPFLAWGAYRAALQLFGLA